MTLPANWLKSGLNPFAETTLRLNSNAETTLPGTPTGKSKRQKTLAKKSDFYRGGGVVEISTERMAGDVMVEANHESIISKLEGQ